MGKKNAVSVRIDVDKIEALHKLAKTSKRARSFVINEAIDLYLELNQWQIQHVKKALKQADAGQFATSLEVSKAFKKWGK